MKKIYLIAICGTGMASLAAMLKAKGYEISGVDENVYPPMSTFLQEQGIPVFQGFNIEHLAARPDLVIIGNAMSRGNPEVEFVLNEKIPYQSLPQALNRYFIRDKYSCVVTGTHGKTTTSSMLAWILQFAQERPSFFIGGMPENFSGGFQLGAGKYIVLEGDEYDSAFFDKGAKFLHYQPDLLIINNIEFDHADIYNSLEEVKTAFRRLINIVPGRGEIIANVDDPVVTELIQNAFSNVRTIGFCEQAQWRAVNCYFDTETTQFEIENDGQGIASVEIRQPGDYNIRNALAAFVAASQLGIPTTTITAALGAFRGVRRRLTLKNKINGMLVYDDFAHHATAVQNTLYALKKRYPGKKLWAIFEPRSASAKRKVFERQYFNAFDPADEVIIAPLHRPDKVEESERLSVENIIENLNIKNIPARILPPGNDMLDYLLKNKTRNDVFLFMSNGEFADMPNSLAERLKIDQ